MKDKKFDIEENQVKEEVIPSGPLSPYYIYKVEDEEILVPRLKFGDISSYNFPNDRNGIIIPYQDRIFYEVKSGEIAIFYGEPGSGKTALLLNIAQQWSEYDDVNWICPHHPSLSESRIFSDWNNWDGFNFTRIAPGYKPLDYVKPNQINIIDDFSPVGSVMDELEAIRQKLENGFCFIANYHSRERFSKKSFGDIDQDWEGFALRIVTVFESQYWDSQLMIYFKGRHPFTLGGQAIEKYVNYDMEPLILEINNGAECFLTI